MSVLEILPHTPYLNPRNSMNPHKYLFSPIIMESRFVEPKGMISTVIT